MASAMIVVVLWITAADDSKSFAFTRLSAYSLSLHARAHQLFVYAQINATVHGTIIIFSRPRTVIANSIAKIR